MSMPHRVWTALKGSDTPPARLLVNTIKAGRRQVAALEDSKHPAVLFFRSAQYRSTLWMRITKGNAVHQTAARTKLDRYPEIFAAIREHFGASGAPRILSFGCSTGEEIVTLRRYLPNAELVGADINARSLSIARNRQVDSKIHFIYSDNTNIQKYGPYDAIFAMAVLQRDPQLVARKGVTSIGKVYPFERYDEQIVQFDKWVKPGGLLIIHHTHYLFTDTSVAHKYVVLSDDTSIGDVYAKFDKNGELMSKEYQSPSVFRKITP